MSTVVRPVIAVTTLLVLAACADGPARPSAQSQLVADTSRYAKLSAADAAMIEVGETAFMNKDAAAAAATVTEDFEWWIIGPDGPKQVVKGRAATEKLIGQFFAASDFESKVYRLGMVGNILVQVEVDTVPQPDGTKKTTTSLELYEFRDGKRWREWRFQPTDSAR
ncbi:MAG: nuclear transport factor 2 family protein [Rhodospirillaceae bacterium]|nr:nuclear transport factor 2 family protein [Rhodospirillaceae bacterium]